MTLLQPQTLKLYYLIFDSLAISAILRPEVRKVLSPPHCQRKSCCCLHINPVCRFVLASQPQRFVFFHSQMKCGSGIELVSDGGRAMNPLLSPGSILKEPGGSWKTPSFPADEGVFPWGKWEVWGKRIENWGLRRGNGEWGLGIGEWMMDDGWWMRRLCGVVFFIGIGLVEGLSRDWYLWAIKALSTGRNNRRHSWNYSEGVVLCNEGVPENMVNVTHGSAGHSESGRWFKQELMKK